MAIKIYNPTDFIADTGWNGRSYPIEDKPDDSEIMYDKMIQNTAYIQANLVAIFTNWISSFFEPNYFRFIRIKTQSTLNDFKSFMKDIYKKDKPYMVIDPRPPEIVEDSIFAQNMLNRYNMVDPEHDNIGMKLLYSMDVMQSDLFELHFRRMRWKVEFDIMIMEESMNRQTNTYTNMIMNIRHNSKFTLIRDVPVLIPIKYIKNIARFHGKDWESAEFLEFLNSISKYPIIKRFLGNGRPMFYLKYELHVYVDVPSFPSKDGPENSEAIELGARIVDQFVFSADLPSEFIFLTKKEYVGRFDHHIEETPDDVTFISPIYADMPWPKELNGFTLTNKVDIEVQVDEDPTLQILPLLEEYHQDVFRTVTEYINRGGAISDLVHVRVFPNGSMQDVGSVLHSDGVLEILKPIPNKLYTACIYVKLKDVNLIRDGKSKEYIGEIEKY
ncbi:MAG: hypothetical protein NC489_08225 [Ruminococcus flavefaciens]|nr:hypothetical protein [Ruminococcus flavefaciens]